MKILGLTGGIGMGKSTAAKSFRRLRVPIFDADATVHALQGRGGRAVGPIGAAFPGTLRDGRVDREALRQAVLGKPEALTRLERIVHPLVRDAERRFLAAARRRAARLVVLDIPLLFETRGQGRCDLVVVVTAPAAVQRWRVLQRKGMTPDRLKAILARQTPDREKRRRADVVVHSGLSRHHAQRAIRRIVREVRSGGEEASLPLLPMS
ncbi:dephospho-CoA kinase [Paeniroseomonas aquatica]|uniref:dephospho-CoA kinase n=1 Tax=Paeniroseomonas aquatica TaxID=373043 RepID=UPI003615C530